MTYTYLIYAVQVSLLMILFYICYHLLFRKNKQFQLNRIILLSSLGLAWIIPLINLQFEFFQQSPLISEFIREANPEAILNPQIKENLPLEAAYVLPQSLSSPTTYWWLYWLGSVFLIAKTLMIFFRIARLKGQNQSTSMGHYQIIQGPGLPSFTFFNWIFIDENNTRRSDFGMILSHELAHSKQKHTFDLFLTELMHALLWFNPVFFFYKKALKENHEYLADESVLQAGYNLDGYARSLQASYLRKTSVQMASYFHGSTLKKRILMALKKESPVNRLRYLLFVPIVILSLGFFSCVQDTVIEIEKKTSPYSAAKRAEIENEANIPSRYPFQSMEGVRVAAKFTKSRMHPILKIKRPHLGIDFSAKQGTPIVASGSGIVKEAYNESNNRKGFGNYVILKHGPSLETFYAHMDEVHVQEGDHIKRGQVMGTVGTTGMTQAPHLHFEIRGLSEERIDPLAFINRYWTDKSEIYVASKSNPQQIINQTFIEKFIQNKHLHFDDEFKLDKSSLALTQKEDAWYLLAHDVKNKKAYTFELMENNDILYLSEYFVRHACPADEAKIDLFVFENGEIKACQSGKLSTAVVTPSEEMMKADTLDYTTSNRLTVDPKDSTKLIYVGPKALRDRFLVKNNRGAVK